jgi:hypothetical protein
VQSTCIPALSAANTWTAGERWPRRIDELRRQAGYDIAIVRIEEICQRPFVKISGGESIASVLT